MGSGQFEAAGFLIEVAEVVLHGRIGPDPLRSFDQGIFGGLVFAQLEIGPAQRIEICAVGGIKIYRFLDQAERLVQLDARGRPACSRDS